MVHRKVTQSAHLKSAGVWDTTTEDHIRQEQKSEATVGAGIKKNLTKNRRAAFFSEILKSPYLTNTPQLNITEITILMFIMNIN